MAAESFSLRAGVYRIRNKINGKLYIGSTIRFDKRFRCHLNDLNGGRHHSQRLQNAWNKYGADAFAFEVVEVVHDIESLLSREQHWLDETAAYRSGYNICPTAGNCLGRKWRPETIAKMSESARRRPPISDETRAKLSAIQKAVPAHVRQRIAERIKGRSPSMETRQKIAAANTGKTHSSETRAKLAAIAANMPQAQRDKIAASLRGRKNGPHTAEAKARMSAAKRAGWAKKKAAQNG